MARECTGRARSGRSTYPPRMPTRRALLARMGATALAFSGLARLGAGPAAARPPRFGPLRPDRDGIFDLPRGFRYTVVSRVGDAMDDGLRVPGSMDGMGAFPGPAGRTLLVRNHELEPIAKHARWSPFRGHAKPDGGLGPAVFYDVRDGVMPDIGGTTTVVYDAKRRKAERQFLSLVGTRRNCAGGVTPWGTWLSCEETTLEVEGSKRDHGYAFEVRPAATPKLVPPVPLKAMGRFRREAVAVHPTAGVVYQSEDQEDGLLYRFLPKVPGQLARGGRLQALVLRDHPQAVTKTGFRVGQRLAVTWVDVEDVTAPKNDLRHRGIAKGAAQFHRGEGLWMGRDALFLCATSGGPKSEGQIWKYVPSPHEGTAGEAKDPGVLSLFVEPRKAEVLENGDNLTVTPWGDLLVCEDHGTPKVVQGNRLMGVTPAGRVYPFGHSRQNGGRSELAGACFAPDGRTLFVNIQFPGTTLAITGPWPAR